MTAPEADPPGPPPSPAPRGVLVTVPRAAFLATPATYLLAAQMARTVVIVQDETGHPLAVLVGAREWEAKVPCGPTTADQAP